MSPSLLQPEFQKSYSPRGVSRSVTISTPWLSLEAVSLVLSTPPQPSFRGQGQRCSWIFLPCFASSRTQWRAHTRQNKTVAINDKWTELPPHLPAHSMLPWRHQPAEAKRSRNIHEGQSDGHRCWGNQYEPRSISPLRVEGRQWWHGELGTLVATGGLCPWD